LVDLFHRTGDVARGKDAAVAYNAAMLSSTQVVIDCSQITSWNAFHDVFSSAFGFPKFYGRNLDAWIDCMTSLDAPDEGMTSVHAPPDGVLVLQLDHAKQLRENQPEIFSALVESSGFVNWRRIDLGNSPVLVLSFDA